MKLFLWLLIAVLTLSIGLHWWLGGPLGASELDPRAGQVDDSSGLVALEATVLSIDSVKASVEAPAELLVRVEELVVGWASGSVLSLRVDRQDWLSQMAEGARALLLLEPAADGSYRLVELESVSGQADMAIATSASRAPRGYQVRACGFDMDDDFVYGEPADDCNVCDGATADPDGDGTSEDLIYVDCDGGTNSSGCGSPGNPCRTVAYAYSSIGDGPGDGAEEIYCIKGTCTDTDIDFFVDGVPGAKLRAAGGSEARDFEYPTDPMMIVGWDADNDGAYPPYDLDDTATFDLSGLTDTWATWVGVRYIEFAHLSFSPNTSSDRSEILFKMQNGGTGVDSDHIYVHDIEIDRWLQNVTDGSAQNVIGHWPNNSVFEWIAFENLQCSNCGGGWFFRGSAGNGNDQPGYGGSGPYRFKNVTITVDSGDNAFYGVTKPWGEVSGIEFLDSHIDYQAGVAWTPDISPAGTCFGIAQCVQDVVIRNVECIGAGRFAFLQASASGSCSTRPLCNSTPGVGTGCLLDANEYVRNYQYLGEAAVLLTEGGPGNTSVGDVTVTNNMVNFAVGGLAGIWDGAVALPGSTVTVVGNTFVGELGAQFASPAGILADPARHENWDVRNNIFDLGTTHPAISISGPSGWSADNNVYPDGSAWWRWNGSNLSTLAQWQIASGGDASARQCSPAYVGGGNYHLDPADTCAQNQGTDISDVTTVDYDADPRPQGGSFDVGADEVTGGPGNTPPTVNISQPADGSTFSEGESIQFVGTATDLEQGDLTVELQWSSNLDGPIGSGGAISAFLSVGTHTVNASVTDSGGLAGSDTVTVTVESGDPPNNPPTVTITSPEENPALGRPVTSNGGEYPGGEVSQIVDGAFDVPDSAWAAQDTPRWVEIDLGHERTLGSLELAPFSGYPGTTYYYDSAWTIQYRNGSGQLQNFSNVTKLRGNGTLTGPGITVIDGDPGTGDSHEGYKLYEFSFDPVVTRYVRLTVVDGDVDGDSNGAELTVREVFPELTPVTLSGSAFDPEQGDLSASISWSSDLEGFLGIGASITRSDLSVGNHVVTAHVADAEGETGSDSIEVWVTSLGILIFQDGLETGDLSRWSASTP